MNSTTIRFALLALATCSLAAQAPPPAAPSGGTETVISTFRVRAGKEANFAKVHARPGPRIAASAWSRKRLIWY